VWALVIWERALGSEQSRWQFVGAGVLAGLAILTKYKRGDLAAPIARFEPASDPQVWGMVVAGIGGAVDDGGGVRVDDGHDVWERAAICRCILCANASDCVSRRCWAKGSLVWLLRVAACCH